MRSKLGLLKGLSEVRSVGSFSERTWAPMAVLRSRLVMLCENSGCLFSPCHQWQERTGRLL